MAGQVAGTGERLRTLKPTLMWVLATLVVLVMLYLIAGRVERMIARWPQSGESAVSPTHCAELIAAHHDPAPFAMTRVALAPCGVHADQPGLFDELAAISVGVIDGEARLDLPYVEDSTAETDMNVVMTGKGLFVEVQGTAEGAPFSREELDSLLELAAGGIGTIHEAQRSYVATEPSPRTFGR